MESQSGLRARIDRKRIVAITGVDDQLVAVLDIDRVGPRSGRNHIIAVARDDHVLTARVLERVRKGPEVNEELSALTEQERKILALIAEGLTNRQIGERLFLAEKTVKNYVSSILAKLGLERRTQAAVLAAKLLR